MGVRTAVRRRGVVAPRVAADSVAVAEAGVGGAVGVVASVGDAAGPSAGAVVAGVVVAGVVVAGGGGSGEGGVGSEVMLPQR